MNARWLDNPYGARQILSVDWCREVKEPRCKACGIHAPMADGTLCQACYDHYSKLLRTQREKTGEFNVRISQLTEPRANPSRATHRNVDSAGQITQALLQPIQDIQALELQRQEVAAETKLLQKQRRNTTIVGCLLLGIGLAVLAASIILSSTILAFIGLGLTLWGTLAFFVQPKAYIRSDLMKTTAISSLKIIDNMLLALGYREKGVYIPAHGSDKAVVFLPSEPFSMIPSVSELGNEATFLQDPAGLVVVPPGSALAALIEKKLGFKLKNCGVEALAEALPKVLVEDLEIVKDVEIEMKDDYVRFKLYDSIYADFCYEVRESSRRCALGCPMCSALANILAVATGKPVIYEEDKMSDDKKITESVYHLISGPRL